MFLNYTYHVFLSLVSKIFYEFVYYKIRSNDTVLTHIIFFILF